MMISVRVGTKRTYCTFNLKLNHRYDNFTIVLVYLDSGVTIFSQFTCKKRVLRWEIIMKLIKLHIYEWEWYLSWLNFPFAFWISVQSPWLQIFHHSKCFSVGHFRHGGGPNFFLTEFYCFVCCFIPRNLSLVLQVLDWVLWVINNTAWQEWVLQLFSLPCHYLVLEYYEKDHYA